MQDLSNIPCLFYTSDVEDQYAFLFQGFIHKSPQIIWSLVLDPQYHHTEETQLTIGKRYLIYVPEEDMFKIYTDLQNNTNPIPCHIPTRFLIILQNDDKEQFVFPLVQIVKTSQNAIIFTFRIEKIFLKKQTVQEHIAYYTSPEFEHKEKTLDDKIVLTAIENIVRQEMIHIKYAQSHKEVYTSQFVKLAKDGSPIYYRDRILRYLFKIDDYDENEYVTQTVTQELADKKFMLQFDANTFASFFQKLQGLFEKSI